MFEFNLLKGFLCFESEKFINNHAAQTAAAQIAAAATAVEEKKGRQEIQIDALLLAYQSIYEAVQLTHQAAQTEAKGMTTNASAQNRLIDWEAGLHFKKSEPRDQLFAVETIETNTKKSMRLILTVVVALCTFFMPRDTLRYRRRWLKKIWKFWKLPTNGFSAVRNILEDNLTLLRQGAQVSETQLNSTIDKTNRVISKVQVCCKC